MNLVALVVDGVKRIYSGPNAGLKHVCLFAITGILSAVSLHFETLQDSIKAGASPDISTIVVGIIAAIAVSIYITGYSLSLMHNAFEDENQELLPEIDSKPFGVFFGALPLMIVWILYAIAVYLLAIIPILGWIALFVLLIIWAPFIQFIYVAYAKNFNTSGLYKISLPIRYMKPAILPIILLGLLFIPVFIIAMIPSFIVGVIIGLTGGSASGMGMYAGGLLGGYLGSMMGLLWAYCSVKIYQEKIEPELD